VNLKRSLGWLVFLAVLAVWIFLAQGMAGKIGAASLEGLVRVFSWPAFGYLLLGNLIGFAVGMLPGLGGPVTMALMLGFAFQLKMDAVEAFSFLLGMMAVTATTGDITSILFGIPGEGSTASTIVEGHPMAKKGEAGRALGASLMSSLMGALIGAGLGAWLLSRESGARPDPLAAAARRMLPPAGVCRMALLTRL